MARPPAFPLCHAVPRTPAARADGSSCLRTQAEPRQPRGPILESKRGPPSRAAHWGFSVCEVRHGLSSCPRSPQLCGPVQPSRPRGTHTLTGQPREMPIKGAEPGVGQGRNFLLPSKWAPGCGAQRFKANSQKNKLTPRRVEKQAPSSMSPEGTAQPGPELPLTALSHELGIHCPSLSCSVRPGKPCLCLLRKWTRGPGQHWGLQDTPGWPCPASQRQTSAGPSATTAEV